jgi:hypothetical protein
MKTKRRKRITFDGPAYYHVMSRIIERRFYLGTAEKEVFCDMMRRVAAFCGIRVLTYCVMNNHFHLLVEVPKWEKLPIEEIERRLPLIYRGEELAVRLQEIQRCRDANNEYLLEKICEEYLRRMYNLSEFMKTLKQRFSIWYNRNNGRKGTLYEDRFTSVLVESPHPVEGDMGNRAILTMAAYIELNPVRAGLVEDPKDYRWCGYAAAVAGYAVAREGIGFVMGFLTQNTVPWEEASEAYRVHLFMRGRYGNAFDPKQVQQVLDRGGKLPLKELLHCRVRYFTDGLVFGSRAFVEEVFHKKRDCFSELRKTGTRRMAGGEWEGLHAARDLRKQVVSVPVALR